LVEESIKNTLQNISENPADKRKPNKNTVIPNIFPPTSNSKGPITIPTPKIIHLKLSINS
jgi:hypothetical protein